MTNPIISIDLDEVRADFYQTKNLALVELPELDPEVQIVRQFGFGNDLIYFAENRGSGVICLDDGSVDVDMLRDVVNRRIYDN